MTTPSVILLMNYFIITKDLSLRLKPLTERSYLRLARTSLYSFGPNLDNLLLPHSLVIRRKLSAPPRWQFLRDTSARNESLSLK